MKMKYAAIILLALGSFLQAVYYYPRLPDSVVSRFDFAGRPGGGMSKTAFTIFEMAMTGGMTVLFVFTHLMIRWLPASSINMPQKDYWLAPERRVQTAWKIQGYMLEFGIATLLFMSAMFHLAVRANLSEPRHLSNGVFWVLFGGYMAFILIWCLRFNRAFSKISLSIQKEK